MDTTLVGVTLLSMAMALSLSVIVWRMLRVERRRSDARVLALVAAKNSVDGEESEGGGDSTESGEPDRFAAFESAAHAGPPTLASAPLASTINPSSTPSPWGVRFVVMGGVGLLGAALMFVALSAHERASIAHRPAAAAASVSAPSRGLELMSLHDERQPGTLTITGLVQNPREGSILKRVTVTAFAFDRNGAFLASGRALLDVTALAPGDESPFVVSVPVGAEVARYRVSFRGEDGTVIAHVDRRQQGALANVARTSSSGT